MEMIEKQEAIDALKAIKYGLWEIDIPSPGNCPEYIEHHKQIKDMMEITDGWIKKLMELPSVQTEIIFCKDCRYSECDSIFNTRYCHNKGKAEMVGDKFFCAAGRYQTNGSD